MIRTHILGIPLATRFARRCFVVAFWAAETSIFVAIARYAIPIDWHSAPSFLLILGLANSLPLLLGGISFGGAVAYYEGDPYRTKPRVRRKLECDPGRARLVLRFLSYYRPADEWEAQLRDRAHHLSHRILFWIVYLGTIAYLLVSATSLAILARFGFGFLDLLLVASMSLPQSCILWSFPNVNAGDLTGDAVEAK